LGSDTIRHEINQSKRERMRIDENDWDNRHFDCSSYRTGTIN
jgi:hypothetical protein